MSGLFKTSLALHGERKESRGRVFKGSLPTVGMQFPASPPYIKEGGEKCAVQNTFIYSAEYHLHIFRQCT